MGYADGHPIRRIGGRLALDFVNTADWSTDGSVVHEKLESLPDLEIWAEAVGLDSLQRPSELTGILALRRTLRRDLLDLVAAIANGQFVPRLPSSGEVGASSLQQALAAAAAGLFIDLNEARRIKICPGENCGWLFLDETGNGRRRWCSMETCGNRTKARRHHLRLKSVEH